ncbi:MAG: hypothetical protein NUV57_02325 [archaeon]|nr:hypothetical protein [archaeon]
MVYSEKEKKELFEKIWSINPVDDRKGTWWWWFWLFFIDNPKNPEKPHQLMILWSTKNEKEIICNNRVFKFPHKINLKKSNAIFDGVTAAWYFDGKMHEAYLLEESKITLTKKPYSLKADSANKTSFFEKNGKFKVIINKGKKKFDFDLKFDETNEFTKPTYSKNNYFKGSLSFSALGLPKSDLTGNISESGKKKKIKGSAYFQHVIVNAPSPSWYWGIFHFPEGSILSYFNPHIGPAVLKGNGTNKFIGKGNISMGDDLSFKSKKTGKKHFRVKKVKIRKNSDGFPVFAVSGENKNEKISFEVDCYSEAYWEFEKKSMGFLKSKLRYNEYPAKIKNFKIRDKKGNSLLSTKEIGEGIGNAEHSWGFLI